MLRHSAVRSELMLTCFPLMTLMAALPELLKFASGRCRHKHSGRNVSYGI